MTTVLNMDFLEVSLILYTRPQAPAPAPPTAPPPLVAQVVPSEHPEVEYLVVDPSCSGTGMALRGGEDTLEPDLERLAALQTRLLSHALSFPGARRVVYSTCATST